MWGRVSEAKDKGSGGISVTTLVIASLSSLAAAVFIHEFWQGGAILGAAITPIIVSIVSELLRRPTDRVTAVVSRRAAPAGGVTVPAAPTRRQAREDRFGLRTDRQRQIRRRRLGLALATGLSAFALAAFLLTSTELVIGNPLGGGGGSSASGGGGGGTTIFGGRSREEDRQQEEDAQDEAPAQTQQAPAPQQDETAPEDAPRTTPETTPEEPAPDGTTPTQPEPTPAPAPTQPAPAPAPAPDPDGAPAP